jgi:hypothetical protein
MNIDYIRSEIEHMRRQILRQRKEIQDLQRAGIPTKSAEELLGRMLAKVDGLCAERDRQEASSAENIPAPTKSSMARSSAASGELVRREGGQPAVD